MINKIIAIDPDVTKSGVAVIDIGHRTVNTYSMTFPDLMEYVETMPFNNSVRLVVEAGWLNKPNWHAAVSLAQAANIGMRIGRNHETGRKMVEMFERMGFSVSLIKPLNKRGSGTGGKITHSELEKVLKGRKIALNKKRTNQDERDSILIAIHEYDRL